MGSRLASFRPSLFSLWFVVVVLLAVVVVVAAREVGLNEACLRAASFAPFKVVLKAFLSWTKTQKRERIVVRDMAPQEDAFTTPFLLPLQL